MQHQRGGVDACGNGQQADALWRASSGGAHAVAGGCDMQASAASSSVGEAPPAQPHDQGHASKTTRSPATCCVSVSSFIQAEASTPKGTTMVSSAVARRQVQCSIGVKQKGRATVSVGRSSRQWRRGQGSRAARMMATRVSVASPMRSAAYVRPQRRAGAADEQKGSPQGGQHKLQQVAGSHGSTIVPGRAERR